MTFETREFSKNFVAALAALSSCATLLGLTLLKGSFIENLQTSSGIIIFLSIILLCVYYACIMSNKKSAVSFQLNQQFKLTIEKGDLFSKKGIIVIPVNEYFDTHVGDGIVSPSTVHGMFINRYFADNIAELENQIQRELENKESKEHINRPIGREEKYELGTCINIKLNGNTYVLLALTHFDKDNHAYVDKREFPVILDKLFEHLRPLSVESPVYMPLIGTGLSRLKRPHQRVLNFIVDAIDFKYSDKDFPKGINIEIYSLDEVNLNKLESHFENDLSI